MDNKKICAATKKNGEPCTAPAVRGDYCIAQCPESAEWRRKGGENSSTAARLEKRMPLRLRPIFDQLEKAVAEVYSGELDPRQAQAMSSLARAMVTVMEAGTFEERIQKLEEKLEATKR